MRKIAKKVLTYCGQYGIIKTVKRGNDLDNNEKGGAEMSKKKGKNKKPTAYDIIKLIIEAVAAIAALILAIRWW